MLVKAIYMQLAVLSLILIWITLSKRRRRVDTLVKTFAVTLLLIGLWLGGVWLYPPIWALFLYAILMIAVFYRHLRKPIAKTALWRSSLSNVPVIFLCLPVGIFLTWQGTSGRLQPSGEFVALKSPFGAEDKTCVLSGGASPLLNFHIFPSSKPRDKAQIYGLDIVAINPLGFRTVQSQIFNPKPKNIQNYAIFSKDVFAPCSGVVVEFENDAQDQLIGGSDKIKTGGNGIVLQCETYHIHMHHFKKGSVLTSLGTSVTVGQKLGKIGNSGNTIEPHLHLHAETIVEQGNTQRQGLPVHMKIDGKFLARGDCL